MSVGNSYARALFETVETQASGVPELLREIEANFKQFVDLVQGSSELEIVLGSPLTTLQEKVSVVKSLSEKLKVSPIFQAFLVLLAKKNRLSVLGAIHDSWNLVRLEAEGGIAGDLASSSTIDGADVESLAKAFSQKLGKKVTFRVTTDLSLLAGIKVTINGVTYDGSLRSQLQKLHDHLAVGASSVHA